MTASLTDVMPKAKKILYYRERRETWRIRLGKQRESLCDQCGEESMWLTTAEATNTACLTEREIFRMVEDGVVHFAESDSGLLLICEGSLKALIR